MKRFKNRARRLIIIASLLFICGCTKLPARESISASYAISEGTHSTFDSVLDEEYSELSGFYPLADGVNSLAARLSLMEVAEHTIDAQYYLFHRQKTTIIFTAFLVAAADRGVRVRLLLDDLSQSENEFDLAALATHPNIEIRLFNPLPHRNLRVLDFITNYSKFSRRMHNKSFIVDNKVFITGGRNIGNAYFSAEDSADFVDLDVVGFGKIVPEASSAFDLYWNHELSYPVEMLYGKTEPGSYEEVYNNLKEYLQENQEDNYVNLLKNKDIINRLMKKEIELDWQKATLFYDHPDKLLGGDHVNEFDMSSDLLQEINQAKQKIIFISPYFIPKEKGVDLIRKWIGDGVDVTVLTNSLAATDVIAVHAGYAKYRADLIRAGVKLWELKPIESSRLRRNYLPRISGSSQASLHAKTIALDDERIFIGTMNLDPRSFDLNTEMGVLIDSSKINSQLSSWFEKRVPELAWRVLLEDEAKDDLVWVDMTDNETIDAEPESSTWRKFQVWFISLLPIENQL